MSKTEEANSPNTKLYILNIYMDEVCYHRSYIFIPLILVLVILVDLDHVECVTSTFESIQFLNTVEVKENIYILKID